ncbi:uncharacterized protein FA14DRAFT_180417 [Meira miltonrushii]|uniref:VWFA domain-containing protein n=1 Tax=Meira miltonrushii TaxID=1280837 RepID=A0A316V8H4_9BASI|nr:uncharacterized protein FA14DRAFT_180417 [Meira miltonrushii]PWN33782.1 hypothetical protein FA14DRAFT_180417 [Meira miltonrushii]
MSRAGGVYGMFGNAAMGGGTTTDSGEQGGSDVFDAQPTTTTDLSDWTIDAPSDKALDLVFIMDATGSMGSYIASATKNIETICDNIIRSEQLSGPGALRLGLLAYRDHPPQDHTYIVKNFGFTPEVSEMKSNLKTLYASGGGDGPEAVTAALHSLLQMEWRQRATRMAVLIADAPPHGIGEYGDGFPSGSPDGNDPLKIARIMAAGGIPLYVVACEPALSGYTYAVDFFQAMVSITGAQLLPLTSASLLAHVIIGAAGEAMDMDRLHRELGDAVADRMKAMSLEGRNSGDAIMDEVTRELHQSLQLRNENTKQLLIESIYRESEASKHNFSVFTQAPDLGTARPLLKRVIGSRLSEKYLQTRSASSSYRSYGDFPHPRASTATAVVATDIYAAKHPASGSPPLITSSFGSVSPSRSPPTGGSRKVISDFSTFSASPGMSFSNAGGSPSLGGQSSTFGASSPPMASFGSPRTNNDYRNSAFNNNSSRNTFDDDDEDDEKFNKPSKPLPVEVNEDGSVEVRGDDGQRLAFRQGAISMEQVRRLAMQSAYRSGLAN